MYCPFCQKEDTKVIDSRLADDGSQVRRRRECIECNERFTTYEVIELNLPRVIKNNGTRVTFDQKKLRAGLLRALEKRPVDTAQVDLALKHIMQRVRANADKELSTKQIGEFVMDQLRQLDQVAYVRFASVYRSFQDVNEFKKEVIRLQSEFDEEVQ